MGSVSQGINFYQRFLFLDVDLGFCETTLQLREVVSGLIYENLGLLCWGNSVNGQVLLTYQ